MSALVAERFDALVARLTPGAPPAPPSDELARFLVETFLQWETTRALGQRAARKLESSFVDLNELRVARVDEICAAIGVRYPRAEERVSLLKRTLNDIYNREHAVTLAPLLQRNKRDAKQYLASLDGCPQYVSARVLVVGLGAHGAPIDALILEHLANAGVFTEPVDLDRAASLLERHIRAEDSLATHLSLESLREEAPDADASKKRPTARRPAPTPAGARAGKKTP